MHPNPILDPTVSHEAVCRTVHDSWRAHERAEYGLSLGLRRLFRDNVHRGRGFSQFADFAEHEFGIPARLAWTFSSLGEHLERLPETRAAVERGELGYTKVREFMRIATPVDERDWIAFARTHTNREIEERVRRARDEKDGREHQVRKEVTSTLTAPQVQAVRKAREKLMRTTGRAVPERELLGALATAVADGAQVGESPREKPRPYVTISLCPNCAATWVPVTGLDMEVRLEEWLGALRGGGEFVNLLEGQLCECTDIKHRRDLCPAARPPSDTPSSSRHVPRSVRRVIEARDGHRCRVPGCTCAGPLEFSHLEPFAEGAPTTPETVVQHCRPHNAMIETGRLVVEGRAPFERYFLADGTLLGTGLDPRPARGGLSHAGQRAESQVESRKPPGAGHRRSA